MSLKIYSCFSFVFYIVFDDANDTDIAHFTFKTNQPRQFWHDLEVDNYLNSNLNWNRCLFLFQKMLQYVRLDFSEVNRAGAGQAVVPRPNWPGNIWTPGGRHGRGSLWTAAANKQRHYRAAWKLHAERRAHKSKAINQPEKSRGNQLYACHNSVVKQHKAVTVLT